MTILLWILAEMSPGTWLYSVAPITTTPHQPMLGWSAGFETALDDSLFRAPDLLHSPYMDADIQRIRRDRWAWKVRRWPGSSEDHSVGRELSGEAAEVEDAIVACHEAAVEIALGTANAGLARELAAPLLDLTHTFARSLDAGRVTLSRSRFVAAVPEEERALLLQEIAGEGGGRAYRAWTRSMEPVALTAAP